MAFECKFFARFCVEGVCEASVLVHFGVAQGVDGAIVFTYRAIGLTRGSRQYVVGFEFGFGKNGREPNHISVFGSGEKGISADSSETRGNGAVFCGNRASVTPCFRVKFCVVYCSGRNGNEQLGKTSHG
jgi:hypothetical protein